MSKMPFYLCVILVVVQGIKVQCQDFAKNAILCFSFTLKLLLIK